MSEDQKTFVQWYYNDGVYHGGQNEVVDPDLMKEKFEREVRYLHLMHIHYPNFIPRYSVDTQNRKVYLEVDGEDFWNQANCTIDCYNNVLPSWQEQMLDIIKAHKSLGLYKFSMHPSSYFIVNGRLKSINYFFCYHRDEGPITIQDHASHIHSKRQNIMKQQTESMGISWSQPESLDVLQQLCFESFRSNYPPKFIEQAKEIYND
jgi:hypothetical protein